MQSDAKNKARQQPGHDHHREIDRERGTEHPRGRDVDREPPECQPVEISGQPDKEKRREIVREVKSDRRAKGSRARGQIGGKKSEDQRPDGDRPCIGSEVARQVMAPGEKRGGDAHPEHGMCKAGGHLLLKVAAKDQLLGRCLDQDRGQREGQMNKERTEGQTRADVIAAKVKRQKDKIERDDRQGDTSKVRDDAGYRSAKQCRGAAPVDEPRGGHRSKRQPEKCPERQNQDAWRIPLCQPPQQRGGEPLAVGSAEVGGQQEKTAQIDCADHRHTRREPPEITLCPGWRNEPVMGAIGGKHGATLPGQPSRRNGALARVGWLVSSAVVTYWKAIFRACQVWNGQQMRLWNLSQSGIALCLALMLSGCLPDGAPQTGGTAARAATVAGGSVVLAGPQGYCIDRSAIRERAGTAVAIFGTCAALARAAGMTQPSRPAILTASVAPMPTENFSESFPQLASFFQSAPGRAALSRSGQAATVTVRQIVSRRDVLLLQLADSAASDGLRVEPSYWRAVFAVRGHMVSLSVMGLQSGPVPDPEKKAILTAFVAAVRAANAPQ